MNNRASTRTHLAPHSRAKVALLGKYLKAYLNVLEFARGTDEVHILDLMCGEGRYADGAEGSPVTIARIVKNHHYSRTPSNRIEMWFNDIGQSEVESDTTKIERVQEICDPFLRSLPEDQYKVRCSDRDALDVGKEAANIIGQRRQTKGLFFIDPHGYKRVKPAHIQHLLDVGGTEVMLFVPASAMYRFANKAAIDPWVGAEALKHFIDSLFGATPPYFESVEDFIEKVRCRFGEFLGPTTYAVSYTLRSDPQNLYVVYFFTRSEAGCEKMLEAVWALDKDGGEGFGLAPHMPGLFDLPHPRFDCYRTDLMTFLSTSPAGRTNAELYRFGLEQGFLPKHTAQILKEWRDDGMIERSYNGRDGQPRSYYLPRVQHSEHPVVVRVVRGDT